MAYINKSYLKEYFKEFFNTKIVNTFAKKTDLDNKLGATDIVEGDNIDITVQADGKVKVSATGDLSVDYTNATNKPKINGVELSGNKTTADLNIESGKIDEIKVNNVAQTITNKSVNITVPTKVSELTNDSNYINEIETSNIDFDTWE